MSNSVMLHMIRKATKTLIAGGGSFPGECDAHLYDAESSVTYKTPKGTVRVVVRMESLNIVSQWYLDDLPISFGIAYEMIQQNILSLAK